MKTYSFIVRVTNSTIIEVNAENFEDAKEIAMDEVHYGGYIIDLLNPSVKIDLELDEEFDEETPEQYPL
jgi:hypothetical protein